MSIIRKVKAVERIFDRLDQEIKTLQAHTHMHCIAGCGRCCTKPDIEATPLEFLPLAFHWLLEGRAYHMLDQLTSDASGLCVAYTPLSLENTASGSCATYPHRGLICRLFGYGASRDKHGQLRMVTCRLIKEQQAEGFLKATDMLQNKGYVPVFSDYYKRLMQIDFVLANQFLPVNEAIREALETVLHYYTYRPLPRKKAA